ncbi:MAG: hypothetical protein U0Z17_02385 [Bacteroidales bacterium]
MIKSLFRMMVEHATFGKGKVLSVEGSGRIKKASVMFESVGPKQLLLKVRKTPVLTTKLSQGQEIT